MSGDGLVRPVNAPGTAPLAYGTQPGTSSPVQRAVIVLVGGSSASGVFVYDPSIGAGNLIASMTDASADPFADTTVKGVASYVTFGGDRFAVALNQVGPGGVPGFTVSDLASVPATPAGVYAAAAASGTADAQLYSGRVAGGDVAASVAVRSATESGISTGQAIIDAGQVQLGLNSTLVINDLANQESANLSVALSAAPIAPASGVSLYANSTGHAAAVSATGLAGSLPQVQVDISTNGPGNTAAATDITKSWSIPANDAAAGTTYTIKCLLTVTTGQTTIETLTIGADIAGTKTALATLGTAFNGGALSTVYAIPLELVMIVDAVTAGTPEVYLNAPLGDTSANRLSTNSVNLQGFTHAASFAKASGGTFAAYVQWGGAGGSVQLAQTISSRLYREGP